MTRVLDSIAVTVVVAAMAAAAAVKGQHVRFPRLPDYSLRNAAVISSGAFSRLTAGARWIGPHDAQVVAVLFSDYACGFCVELHYTLAQLRELHPSTLAIVIRHFVSPDRPDEQKVALAAECAGELNAFEAYHDAAFANARLVRYTMGWQAIAEAAHVGDIDGLIECTDAARYRHRLTHDWRIAQQYGVGATPTLFVNGTRLVGAIPLPVLDSIVTAQAMIAQRSSRH